MPNAVTFVVVLYARSHSRMMDEGIGHFNAMDKDFGVVPGAEHYACMVDLLGLAGRLGNAMKPIKNAYITYPHCVDSTAKCS